MKKITAAIAGGAGYTGGELLRLLLNHPHVTISHVLSRSQSGKPVWMAHPDLLGETDLCFTEKSGAETDVLFLCLGHGESSAFLQENPVSEKTVIIDLSQDHRHDGRNAGREFIYGLPEVNRKAIAGAEAVANPGCFATCIQLALLPLAANKILNGEIHISATTGSTGAGQSLSETSHFSWRNNNLSVYKAFEHQHLKEIAGTIRRLQPAWNNVINFIPYRGSFTRGILASLYLDFKGSPEEAMNMFRMFYDMEPFVVLSGHDLDLKQVVNTNKCFLRIRMHGKKLFVESAIDNLLKGASGQAVQNMNIVFGLPETTGLKLKAVAF